MHGPFPDHKLVAPALAQENPRLRGTVHAQVLAARAKVASDEHRLRGCTNTMGNIAIMTMGTGPYCNELSCGSQMGLMVQFVNKHKKVQELKRAWAISSQGTAIEPYVFLMLRETDPTDIKLDL